jgi:hypothetical protein
MKFQAGNGPHVPVGDRQHKTRFDPAARLARRHQRSSSVDRSDHQRVPARYFDMSGTSRYRTRRAACSGRSAPSVFAAFSLAAGLALAAVITPHFT